MDYSSPHKAEDSSQLPIPLHHGVHRVAKVAVVLFQLGERWYLVVANHVQEAWVPGTAEAESLYGPTNAL